MTATEIALIVGGLALLVAGLAMTFLAPRLASGLSEAVRPGVQAPRRAPAQARMQVLIAGQTEARQRARRLAGRFRIGGLVVTLAGAALAIAAIVLGLTPG